MLKRLNKKGLVFADVLGAIQRTISWFIDSAPKPLKLLLFLLFLTVFSALFGLLLNTTGHFCDTQGNLYKTGFFSIATNIDLLTDIPDKDKINDPVIDPDDDVVRSTLAECVGYYGTGWKYKDENKVVQNLTADYYYRSSDTCVECDIVKTYSDTQSNPERICLGNAYRKDHDNMSWWGRTTCGKWIGFCTPPTGYYYDSNQEGYVCLDITNQTCEDITPAKLWNDKLASIDAKIVTKQEISDRDYRKAVSIDCDVGDTTPKFKFFSVPVFDYRLWITIIFLAALVWGLKHIKKK